MSIRGEHGREGAGCNDGTSALTGHLRGRRLSAGCGGRRCCNVLRELASFVGDHPTQQLQLRLFYTKTAGKAHTKVYHQIVDYGWSTMGQCMFQEDLEILQ